MKVNQITGFVISTALHAGLAFVLLPLLWADEPKPKEPEPILLELSSFEPPPLPEPKSVIEEKTLEPPPAPKKEKPVEPPKPKPEPVPVVQEKKLELPPKKPIEQVLPKPEPNPEVLQQPVQEHQRLAALKAQRHREFIERQQQEQERQRLEQQQQQEQAKRRAEWEQTQQREAAIKRQAEAKAEAEQQTRAVQTTALKASLPVTTHVSNEMPVISNPRYRSPPSPPEYPRRALEAGIEGTVLVRVTISADGHIVAVLVHQSSGNASLDAAALKAVRGWSFMPAQRDGKTIPSIVQLPVRFKLS